jgi:hypothetical protein
MACAATETPTAQSGRAAERFEGLWAKTKEECLDEDGPNNRTLVDLRNVVSGKAAPIFDQYENHCLIERKNIVGNDMTLTVTCFEFWENFTKRTEGTKGIVKLTLGQKGGLKIDGKKYEYCANQPASDTQPNTTTAAPAPSSQHQKPMNKTGHGNNK